MDPIVRSSSADIPPQQDGVTSVSDVATSVAPPRGFGSSLRANLLVGLRVFFFRRTQPEDIVSSFDQVVGLLLALLGVVAVLDRATAGADAEFNVFGVYTWSALLLVGLWICAR